MRTAQPTIVIEEVLDRARQGVTEPFRRWNPLAYPPGLPHMHRNSAAEAGFTSDNLQYQNRDKPLCVQRLRLGCDVVHGLLLKKSN